MRNNSGQMNIFFTRKVPCIKTVPDVAGLVFDKGFYENINCINCNKKTTSEAEMYSISSKEYLNLGSVSHAPFLSPNFKFIKP